MLATQFDSVEAIWS